MGTPNEIAVDKRGKEQKASGKAAIEVKSPTVLRKRITVPADRDLPDSRCVSENQVFPKPKTPCGVHDHHIPDEFWVTKVWSYEGCLRSSKTERDRDVEA
jgi:hypothetical protein